MTSTQVLPLRPMTVGELLDAAASLLRVHWRPLLAGSFVLALGEQIIMTWIRVAQTRRVDGWQTFELLGDGTMWLWMFLGLTTEIIIITLLGVPAARAVEATLLGRVAGWRELYEPSAGRWGPVAVVTLVVGTVGAVAAVMCGLPWLLVYAFIGLIVPVLVIERQPLGGSIGRGLKLVTQAGGRPAGVRLLGYASWVFIRLAISCGAYVLAEQVSGYSQILQGNYWFVLGAAYLAINTMAYAMLACLDAVIYVETRIRSEGLDIVLARAHAHGTRPDLSPPRFANAPPVPAHPMGVMPPQGGPR